jgi:RNA polymerase sigma factor (sigma-70 family)
MSEAEIASGRSTDISLCVDVDLLRRFFAGDTVATRRVEHWAREVVFFRYQHALGAEAEDIVQDTLIGLVREAGRPDFALRHGLRSLVRHIATARCIDYMRRRRPSVEVAENTLVEDAGPLEELIAAEEIELLFAALGQLKEPERALLREHYAENLTSVEMAARRGLADSTIRVELMNCRQKLQRILRHMQRARTP